MEKIVFGKTGIRVSTFMMGTWEFARDAIWGDNAEELSIRAIHAALDAGINFFDSAEGYGEGNAEKVLGRALAGRRGDAVIATKALAANLTKAGLAASCEKSLQRLGSDYIDIYQIHWPSRTIPLEETMEALHDLLRQGKIRAIGVCNFGVQDLERLYKLGGAECDQLPYSLLNRAVEDAILPACRSKGMMIMAYSPLAMGLLSGKYHRAEDVPAGRTNTRYYHHSRTAYTRHTEDGMEELLFKTIADIRQICDETKISMNALALAWLRAQKAVDFVLCGVRNEKQLAGNLAAYNQTVSADILVRLTALSEGVKKALGGNPDLWQNGENARIH
ncbi:MAG: aldo/keto reductase [Spirochaetales bacterium]|nr:aldo/keto reductase [Spirochaetales bacterium]